MLLGLVKKYDKFLPQKIYNKMEHNNVKCTYKQNSFSLH